MSFGKIMLQGQKGKIMRFKELIAAMLVKGINEVEFKRVPDGTQIHMKAGDQEETKVVADDILFSLSIDVADIFVNDMVKALDNYAK